MEESWTLETSEIFGRVLVELRDSARLSQRKLAAISGVSHTTIARLESGKAGSRGKPVRPSPDTISALAHGLAERGTRVVSEGRLRSIYARLMQAAAYRLAMVNDPGETVDRVLATPEEREERERRAVETSMELGELADGLKEAVDNGKIGRDRREILMVIGILRSILDSVDPDFEYHTRPEGE
jgi:transcriptional regulator with XRE-family HTH domain